MIDIS